MSDIICKLPNGKYILWSTVVDAPTTYGMTREVLDQFMRDEHGRQYMELEHPRRMKRVEAIGTSSMLDRSLEELISLNHAGPNGSRATLEQIVEIYGEPPKDDTSKSES